jgi:peptidoglycan/xylan/chitin deacetylase (PgdA/CDA1 family)
MSAMQWGRCIAAWGYSASGEYDRFLQGKLSILMYHRVLSTNHPDLAWVQPGMYVQQDSFERQIVFLKERFEILSFANVLELWREGRWDAKKRYCTITFDDGWLDNYRYAWPILQRYAVPATIFLPTSWIGTSRWFWPDRLGFLLCAGNSAAGSRQWGEVRAVLRRRGFRVPDGQIPPKEFSELVIQAAKDRSVEEVEMLIETIQGTTGIALPAERILMNWDEVGAMSRQGITFGSHACTHTLLPQLTSEQCAGELAESVRVLEARGSNTVPVFCYPNGSYNEAIAKQVAQAGYTAAVTTDFGYETSHPPNMQALHRIGIHDDVASDDALFAWRLGSPDRRVKRWARTLFRQSG